MENSTLYRAVGYARLSKEDGMATESGSIGNQRLVISQYAARHPEICLGDVIADDGYSGADFERPGFQTVMQAVSAGSCNCIIVKDLSRFGRDYLETGKLIEQTFPAMGVRFIAVNDQYDSLESGGFSEGLMLPLRNLVNDMYSRDISLKIRSQFAVKRMRGEFTGAFAVYGYRKSREEKGRLEPDPDAAAVVRQIFAWKIDGLSFRAIAERLNQEGELSPADYKRSSGDAYRTHFQLNDNVRWTAQTVKRILCNECYTGVMEQNKRTSPSCKVKQRRLLPKEQWVRVEHTHDPIVNRWIFLLVRRLMAGAEHRVRGGGGSVTPFAGLLFCAGCGAAMKRHSTARGGRTYAYYSCPDCRCAGSVREELLSDAVGRFLDKRLACLPDPPCFYNTGSAPGTVAAYERRLADKQRELARYQELLRSVEEDFREGILTQEECSEYSALYTDRLRNCEAVSARLAEESREPGKRGRQEHTTGKNPVSRTEAALLIRKIKIYSAGRIRVFFHYSDSLPGTDSEEGC